MLDVTTSVIIHRSRDVVASFAADPSNAPSWYANIKSVDWLTAPPLQIGTRLAFVAAFLGRTLVYTYEITEWTPNAHLIMKTADGPFTMETTYTWMSVDSDRTQMNLQNRGMPTGFSKLLAPFLGLAVCMANRKDLLRLKELLETGKL